MFGVCSSVASSEMLEILPDADRDITDKSAAIYFNSDVNSESIGNIVYAINNINIKYPKLKNIYLYINSEGGALSSSVVAYSAIKYSTIPVVTVGVANVSSVATILYCAGSERLSTEEGKFYYHPISINSAGPLDREMVNELSENVENAKRTVKNIYSTCTNFTDAEIDRFMLSESNRIILTPEQAIERKIASGILEKFPNPALIYTIFGK